jgi:hypothetical protein
MSVNLDLGKKTLIDQTLVSTKHLKTESNHTASLPLELWSMVASHLQDDDLNSLSQVSKTCKVAALKEKCIQKTQEAKMELRALEELNPKQTELKTPLLEFYQSMILKLARNPEEKYIRMLPKLKQQLTELTTHHVAKEFLELNRECYQKIDQNKIHFEYLDQKYLRKQADFVNEALEYVISAHEASDEKRGFILEEAAQSGFVEIVRALVASGRKIPAEKKGAAVKSAAHNGYLEILRILLANEEILASSRELAVKYAAQNDFVEGIKLLLANGLISPKCKLSALKIAVENDRVETLKYLLIQWHISQEQKSALYNSAAKRGHLDVMAVLFTHKTIDQSPLAFSAEQGSYDMVKQYLYFSDFSDQELGVAVICAASLGHKEILMLLLNHSSISKEYRARALTLAAEKGYLEIVKLLVANGPIDPTDKARAIMISKKGKQLATHDFLKTI